MSASGAPGASLQKDAGTDDSGGSSRPSGPVGRGRTSPRRWSPALVVSGLLAILATPLVVALGTLRRPRWYPTLDLAMTELRVRDVWSRHPPLIGLPGRIGRSLFEQGSHPGPLSFWAMWPVYRLFGAGSWAMQVASVVLHLVAVGVVLWVAHRRGGARLVVAVAAALALLTRLYGTATLTEAWNPYLPVMFWLAFLFAVWSVVCGDVALLPVAAAAGSFCLQTHISYAGLVPGLAALAVGATVYWDRARRHQAADRRSLRLWAAAAAAVTVVLWTPPLIDQLTRDPGNLTIIWRYFTNPPEAAIGPGPGVKLVLVHLNPWRLVTGQWANTGSVLPGLALLVAWVSSAVVAWRLRHRTLLRLDLVLAVSLVLGAFSASRIFGKVWYYLALWAWGLNAVVVLSVAWTLVLVVSGRRPAPTRGRELRAVTLAALGVTLVSTLVFTVDATSAKSRDATLSRVLGHLMPPTLAALDRGSVPGGGRAGRYLVTWVDPVDIGAQGYGILDELDRHGLRAGLLPPYRPGATDHRVLEPSGATAVVHLSVGPADIERWRAKGDAREVAFYEPRSPAQVVEYEQVRARVIADLQAAGLAYRVPDVDSNLFGIVADGRVPQPITDLLDRMVNLGTPSAMFVGPPGATS